MEYGPWFRCKFRKRCNPNDFPLNHIYPRALLETLWPIRYYSKSTKGKLRRNKLFAIFLAVRNALLLSLFLSLIITTFLIWCFHERSWSIFNFKKFVVFTCSIFWLPMFVLKMFVSFLVFALKITKFVFFKFNDNLLTASQFATLQSSTLALSQFLNIFVTDE